MIKVDVNQALKQFKSLTNQLSSKEVAKAQVRAINHTISKAKTMTYKAIKQEIGKDLNISGAGIKQSISIRRATTGNMYGWVIVKGMPLPIIAFKPKQTEEGITFSVRKGETYTIKGAFIAKSGKKNVFARGRYAKKGGSFLFSKGRKGNNKVKTKKGIVAYPELPITAMRTISLPNIFASKGIQNLVGDDINKTYVDRLQHELKRIIDTPKPA